MNRSLGAALTVTVAVLTFILLTMIPSYGMPPIWAVMGLLFTLAVARILEY